MTEPAAEPSFEEKLADIVVSAVKMGIAPLSARLQTLEQQRVQDAETIALLRERVAVVEKKA